MLSLGTCLLHTIIQKCLIENIDKYLNNSYVTFLEISYIHLSKDAFLNKLNKENVMDSELEDVSNCSLMSLDHPLKTDLNTVPIC